MRGEKSGTGVTNTLPERGLGHLTVAVLACVNRTDSLFDVDAEAVDNVFHSSIRLGN